MVTKKAVLKKEKESSFEAVTCQQRKNSNYGLLTKTKQKKTKMHSIALGNCLEEEGAEASTYVILAKGYVRSSISLSRRLLLGANSSWFLCFKKKKYGKMQKSGLIKKNSPRIYLMVLPFSPQSTKFLVLSWIPFRIFYILGRDCSGWLHSFKTGWQQLYSNKN